MTTSAKSKMKAAVAGIAALALGSAAMIMPVAAQQRVSDHRASHSVSFYPPAAPAPVPAYRALSTMIGVGY